MANTKDKKEKSFEALLRKLEQNVEDLESGDVPIEEALKLFEEGIRLSKVLTTRLTDAEKKVRKLVETADGEFKLADFVGEENDD